MASQRSDAKQPQRLGLSGKIGFRGGHGWPRIFQLAIAAMLCFGLLSGHMQAQLSGAGSINGSVIDRTGAYVAGATVTATNVATGGKTVQTTTSSGYYVLSLDAGTYTVEVVAKGFKTLTQDKISVDATQVVGLNLTVQVGTVSEHVEVSAAPPVLDTASATLGGTIENQSYIALPLLMNGGARDPTAFMYLMPGVGQSGGGYGVFNGVGSYGSNGELYIDGVPTTRVAIQGDTRNVSDSVSVEAVDQFQVVTSGSPVVYQGIGSQNYVIKSGTNQIHGSLFEFLRNTVLDTWGWAAPAVINLATGTPVKPVEHQNEFGLEAGGPILKDRIFLFGMYSGFAYAKTANPTLNTVPTLQELNGNFSDLPAGQNIYDPSTTSCNSAGQCTRAQFDYNGVPNAMNPSAITNLAKALIKGYPTPNIPNTVSNNWLAATPTSSYAWKTDGKIDAVLTSKQRVAAVFTANKNYPHGYNGGPLPLPWVFGQIAVPYTKNLILEHNYVVTNHLVNQLKWAFIHYLDDVGNASDNPAYGAATAYGIKGLPGGQTNTTFPTTTFSAPNGLSGWDGNKQYIEVTNTYDIVDNVQYIHDKHSLIFGAIHQWQQDNFNNYSTGNSPLTLAYSNAETGGYSAITGSGGGILNTSTGDSFASFLLDQVDSASFTTSAVVSTYARMRPWSLYTQDDYKMSQKLTVNLGLRWDWFPPFGEKYNRSSWLNPTMINPAVNYPGALLFAGNGADSCSCTTPLHNWYKNFGPRIGVAYSLDPKTVLRGGFTINYSHTTGVNNIGREGTLTQGYAATPKAVSPGSGIAAFILDNGFPSYQAPPFLNAGYGAGYSTTISTSAQSMYYADPYVGSRAPYAINWNAGVERALTKDITINVNYVGSQGHFLGESSNGARGYWSNQLNPLYYNLGSLLNATPTAANLLAVQAIDPGVVLPYPTFGGSGGTIAQMLRPFPQYSGVTDSYGDIANSNYNALQLILNKRLSQGLQFMMNYSYSHEIDDQGTYRSGYLPTRADRSRGSEDAPQILNSTAVYSLPFGKGHSLGDRNFVVRSLVSGWQTSGIFTYTSGHPLLITSSGCNQPNAGTCMPNYVPGFTGPIRLNGSWGHGALAGKTSPNYIAGKNVAFADPPAYTIGNVARTAAYGLRAPGNYNINMSLKRTFPLHDNVKLLFDVSAYNLTNKVLFGISSTSIDSGSFGQVSGQSNASRDIQLAARINF